MLFACETEVLDSLVVPSPLSTYVLVYRVQLRGLLSTYMERTSFCCGVILNETQLMMEIPHNKCKIVL
jgi:hypothetical protein